MVLLAAVCAWASSWANAPEELNRRLAELTHFAAEFTQRLEDRDGELIEESSGRVRLQRLRNQAGSRSGTLHSTDDPDAEVIAAQAVAFRWEVIEPYAQVLVAANGQLKLYDPDLEQMTVRPLDEALNDTPLALLTQNRLVLGEGYAVVQLDEHRFSVRPHADDALFEEIELAFGKSGLAGISIRDHLGQATVVRFHGFQDASVIQSADFELTVPLGTDVY